MFMGANGRRNNGLIRPAEWRRNGSKNAAAPPKTRSHQPDTACRHWETYIIRKNNINNLHKINVCFYDKKLHFVEKIFIWLLIQHSTVIHIQTIHNTTNNTQHKIHSCYIISFETFFDRFWRGGLVELDWFSWTVCWQRQKMVVRVRVRCTEPSLHSPHS